MSCTAPRARAVPPPALATEQAVYAAVLDTLAARASAPQLVVHDSTWTGLAAGPAFTFVDIALRALPGVDDRMVADFEVRNTQPRAIPPALASVPVTLVGQRELAELPRVEPDGYWSTLFERYPGTPGIVTLSRPGLDDTRTRAIVAAQLACGPLCSTGFLFLLVHEDGVWRVSAERVLWVS